MANYYASCRTNYFKVKDEAAFINEMQKFEVDVCQEPQGFCILGNDPDGACWPYWMYDEKTGDDEEIDFFSIVAEHLQDGEVAIFMEAGAEKLRYVSGYAVAVNNKGESKTISLQNIYDLAKELTDRPDDVTPAEY